MSDKSDEQIEFNTKVQDRLLKIREVVEILVFDSPLQDVQRKALSFVLDLTAELLKLSDTDFRRWRDRQVAEDAEGIRHVRSDGSRCLGAMFSM
jgi:hypothetical protein